MRQEKHVACMGDRKCGNRFGGEAWWYRDHLEDLGVDERIILKWILNSQGSNAWTGSIWFSIEARGRALVITAMNLMFPHNARNSLSIWETVSFSIIMLHNEVLCVCVCVCAILH
jgi:hypothetical protein